MRKKHRNTLAYARNSHPSSLSNSHSMESISADSPNVSMYHSVLAQMSSSHSSYITKLQNRSERFNPHNFRREEKRSEQNKTYAEVMLSASNDSNQKAPTHDKATIVKTLFQGSLSFKNPSIVSNLSHSPHYQPQNSKFLHSLDAYLQALSQTSKGKDRSGSRQKSRLNRVLRNEHVSAEELRMQNDRLREDNAKISRNHLRAKQKFKSRMGEIIDYARSLTDQLEQQKSQRRGLEKTVAKMKQKLVRLQNKGRSQRQGWREKLLDKDILDKILSSGDDSEQIQQLGSRGQKVDTRKSRSKAKLHESHWQYQSSSQEEDAYN